MRGHDEVYKDLGGFLNLWSAMANDDFFGEFRRKNEPVSQYWRDVKVALDLLLLAEETAFSQDQGLLLLKLTNFRKMIHCTRNLLETYLTLVVGRPSSQVISSCQRCICWILPCNLAYY